MNHYPFYPGGQPAWPSATQSLISSDRRFQTACYAHFVARQRLSDVREMTWEAFKTLWIEKFDSVYQSAGAGRPDIVEGRLHAPKKIRKSKKKPSLKPGVLHDVKQKHHMGAHSKA